MKTPLPDATAASQSSIPNDGIPDVRDPRSDESLRLLRGELESYAFTAKGQQGLCSILGAFVTTPAKVEPTTVWLTGPMGSGRSSFLRVFSSLWTDLALREDGLTARQVTRLPADVAGALDGLHRRGSCEGGLHAAMGSPAAHLAPEHGDDLRLAVLEIVFRSAGLPREYHLASFVMWLRRTGYLEGVRAAVEARGLSWAAELRAGFPSPVLAEALLGVYPEFAPGPVEACRLLGEKFPAVQAISTEQMIQRLREALGRDGRMPLTLVALDDVGDVVCDNPRRARSLVQTIEAFWTALGGRLLFIATGCTEGPCAGPVADLQRMCTLRLKLDARDGASR